MTITVHSLRISHKHGDDLSVHASEEEVWSELYDYAKRSWDDFLFGPIPADEREAVNEYFEHMSHSESYAVDEHAIHGAMWEPGFVAASIAKDREAAK